MKFSFLFAILLLASAPAIGFARDDGDDDDHVDVEFGYDDPANPMFLDLEANLVTSEGLMIFEGGFETDAFDPNDILTREPGFTTNPGEGLIVNPGDRVWLEVLDASAFSSVSNSLGFVNYWDAATNTVTAAGSLGIDDFSTETENLILDGASILSGINRQVIGTDSGDGDVHNDLLFDLLEDGNAGLGGYGLLLQLHVGDAVANPATDISSAPFWVVLNNGIDEDDFDSRGLAAFGVAAIPEPASASILGLGLALVFVRRRRIVG